MRTACPGAKSATNGPVPPRGDGRSLFGARLAACTASSRGSCIPGAKVNGGCGRGAAGAIVVAVPACAVVVPAAVVVDVVAGDGVVVAAGAGRAAGRPKTMMWCTTLRSPGRTSNAFTHLSSVKVVGISKYLYSSVPLAGTG